MIYYEDRDFLIERLDYRDKGYYIMYSKTRNEIDFVVDIIVNPLEEWIAFGKRLSRIEKEQEKRAIKEGLILQSRGNELEKSGYPTQTMNEINRELLKRLKNKLKLLQDKEEQ